MATWIVVLHAKLLIRERRQNMRADRFGLLFCTVGQKHTFLKSLTKKSAKKIFRLLYVKEDFDNMVESNTDHVTRTLKID